MFLNYKLLWHDWFLYLNLAQYKQDINAYETSIWLSKNNQYTQTNSHYSYTWLLGSSRQENIQVKAENHPPPPPHLKYS